MHLPRELLWIYSPKSHPCYMQRASGLCLHVNRKQRLLGSQFRKMKTKYKNTSWKCHSAGSPQPSDYYVNIVHQLYQYCASVYWPITILTKVNQSNSAQIAALPANPHQPPLKSNICYPWTGDTHSLKWNFPPNDLVNTRTHFYFVVLTQEGIKSPPSIYHGVILM